MLRMWNSLTLSFSLLPYIAYYDRNEKDLDKSTPS